MPSLNGELKQVLIQDLHAYWPFVKEGLVEVKKHSAEDWIAEDVYTAIRTGASSLYVSYVDSTYSGFCVLTLMQGYASKSLHIWIAYGVKGMNVVERFESELVKLALKSGAAKLSFMSPRRGWERKLKDYKVKQVIFEKDILCQAADPQT